VVNLRGNRIRRQGDYRVRNGCLAALSSEVFNQIEADLELVSLEAGAILTDAGRPTRSIFFVESGLISRAISSHHTSDVTVALVGSSGFVGVSVLLEAKTSLHRTKVMVAGTAIQMDARKLLKAAARNKQLREHLLRYVRALFNEISESAFSNAVHGIEERLCRFLIRSSEALGTPVLPFTHKDLSEFLGVRRASVTEGIGRLETLGALTGSRGLVEIANFSTLRKQI
jgi:CRP-like cAMP-binding protein